MERPVVDRSVAEEGDRDPVGAGQLEAVAAADGLEDAGADDATGAHHPDLGGEQVHAAAPALGRPGLATEQLGDQQVRGESLGEGVAVTPVRAEDDIVGFEMSTHPAGDCLFADIRVTGPVNQPALMTPRQFFLALTDQLHCSIQVQRGLAVGECAGFSCHEWTRKSRQSPVSRWTLCRESIARRASASCRLMMTESVPTVLPMAGDRRPVMTDSS